MKQREMEQEFSENLTQIKLSHQQVNDEQLQTIVMEKNKAIGDLFNKHKEATEKAE